MWVDRSSDKARRAFRATFGCVGMALALIVLPSCQQQEPRKGKTSSNLTLVTGYCNCGKCCGWERSWFGFGGPVYNYGSLKGKPKQIGVTASGTRAHHGTIAADPKLFRFGTRLYVPGYGVGTVEDVGGAIKGRHIDIWFPTHEQAAAWGSRWLKVERR